MWMRGSPMALQQRILGAWVCLLLLFHASALCQGLHGLQLQPNGKYGLVMPLEIRHGVHRVRGRSLLRSGTLAVQGAVREGYFYAQLSLGTPPRNFSTIIDTGSTITYIPCANCQHCGKHMDNGFDPSKSSTAKLLSCQHDLCQCGSPSCSCVEHRCYYIRHYAELSSSEGWLVLDKLQFPDRGSSLDFVFGCENKETGAIYAQHVDGVLGMGNNVNSFPRQLARSGVVDDVFSLCFGFPKGGSLLLGDVSLDPALKLQYTPLLDMQHHYYNVDLQSISLAGKSLAVNVADYARGYGSVLDSGTTFTYLPTPAFNAFVALLFDAIRGKGLTRASGDDPQPDANDVCWKGAPADFTGIDRYFPTGKVIFGGGVSIKLTPQRYLFSVGHGEYCLGMFDNGNQGTLIGGIIVRNVLVQYVKKRFRVGFVEVDCHNIPRASAASSANNSTTSKRSCRTATNPAAAAVAVIGLQYVKKRFRVGFVEVDCHNIPRASAASSANNSTTSKRSCRTATNPAAAAVAVIGLQYDKKRSRVGFVEVDCHNIPRASAAKPPTTASPAAGGSVPAAAGAAAHEAQDASADDSDGAGTQEPQQKQQDEQQQADSSESGAADDRQHPGRQQTQHQSDSSSGSSIPEQGSSSSSIEQRSGWLQAFSSRDVWLGIVAGAVVVAAVVQGVQMYIRRRRRHTGGAAGGSAAAEGVRYKEVRLSELDIETELTPLAGHAAAGAQGSSAV